MSSPKELYDFVCSELDRITSTTADWAKMEKGLFDGLKNLGISKGYDVYEKIGLGEYLVDLCWYFGGEKELVQGRHWMELACEIEWSSQKLENIIEDMEKLVDIKANIKLGISSPTTKDKEDVRIQIAETIRNSMIKVPSEQYLLIYAIYQPHVKPEERFDVRGYSYDTLGNEIFLGSKKISWEYEE